MGLLRVEQVDGYKLSLVQNISTCNWKLKFSMKTHQTHINILFENCHARCFECRRWGCIFNSSEK